MRITLILDDDVLDKAKAVAEKRQAPFRSIVNEALRVGLQVIEESPLQPLPELEGFVPDGWKEDIY